MSTPEPTASPKVTRNVPPKRVRVADNANIVVNEESFSGGDEVIVEGPVADELALAGQVTVIESVPDAKGFDFTPADEHAVPHDVTAERTALGQTHDATGTMATEEDFA